MDPLVPAVSSAFARRYDESLRRFLEVRDLHPDIIAIHPLIGAVWQEKHEYDKAMAEYHVALPQIPDQVKTRIAILLAAMGKRDEALRKVEELEHPKAGEGPVGAFDMAASMRRWAIAITPSNGWAVLMVVGSSGFSRSIRRWNPLRGDPRCAELLKKTGL